MNIDHLSYSSISMYLGCPAAWRFKYIEQVKTPVAPELVFGSAFHQAIENYIARGGNIVEHWSEAWASKSTEQEIAWDGNTPAEMFNQGIAMLTTPNVREAIEGIDPKFHADGKAAIETEVRLNVDGVPVPIVGFVDLLHADGSVCDLKTSSRQWSDDKARAETQPLFYLAALDQMGIDHNGIFRHYVFVKGKSPKVQIIETKRTQDEIRWLERMIRNVWKAIDAEVFPENPTTWKHDPRYCDYWGRCVSAG